LCQIGYDAEPFVRVQQHSPTSFAEVPLTHLLALAAKGECGALVRVFAVLNPELRKIAHVGEHGSQ
jgi:hypothetical protein